jgi:hypothetical protein
MKFDGHVKLTTKALKQMKHNCPVMTGVCNAPMFKSSNGRVWLGNKKTSNSLDNYSSAIVNYLGASITPDILVQVTLPDAVAFVDLSERWTHEDPKGQRYHFMKSSNQTETQAYLLGVRFIKTHTENWVNTAKILIGTKIEKQKPLQNASWRNTRKYVEELALALHCLQDAFSPGHVERITPTKTPVGGLTGVSTPIRKIYDYSKQNHDDHGEHDYTQGAPDSNWGASAVNASVALMSMGIMSIHQQGWGLKGWPQFKSNWLPRALD